MFEESNRAAFSLTTMTISSTSLIAFRRGFHLFASIPRTAEMPWVRGITGAVAVSVISGVAGIAIVPVVDGIVGTAPVRHGDEQEPGL